MSVRKELINAAEAVERALDTERAKDLHPALEIFQSMPKPGIRSLLPVFDNIDAHTARTLMAIVSAGVGRSGDDRCFIPIYQPIIINEHPGRTGAAWNALDLSELSEQCLNAGIDIEWLDTLFVPPLCDIESFIARRSIIEDVETGKCGGEVLRSPSPPPQNLPRNSTLLGIAYACGIMRFNTLDSNVMSMLTDLPLPTPLQQVILFSVRDAITGALDDHLQSVALAQPAPHVMACVSAGRSLFSASCSIMLRDYAESHRVSPDALSLLDVDVSESGNPARLQATVRFKGPGIPESSIISAPLPAGFTLLPPFGASKNLLLNEIAATTGARIEPTGHSDSPGTDAYEAWFEELLAELDDFSETGDDEALFNAALRVAESPRVNAYVRALDEEAPDIANLLDRISQPGLRAINGAVYLPVVIPISIIDNPDRERPLFRYAELDVLSRAINQAQSGVEIALVNHIYRRDDLEGLAISPAVLFDLILGGEEIPPNELCQADVFYNHAKIERALPSDVFFLVGVLRATSPCPALTDLLAGALPYSLESLLDNPGVSKAFDLLRKDALADGVEMIPHPITALEYNDELGRAFHTFVRAGIATRRANTVPLGPTSIRRSSLILEMIAPEDGEIQISADGEDGDAEIGLTGMCAEIQLSLEGEHADPVSIFVPCGNCPARALERLQALVPKTLEQMGMRAIPTAGPGQAAR